MAKRRKGRSFSDLGNDAKAVLRTILRLVIRGPLHGLHIHGVTEDEKIDGVVELIEAGFLRLCGDDTGRYWLEPTLPETMPDIGRPDDPRVH
jgi:hypothetical protein